MSIFWKLKEKLNISYYFVKKKVIITLTCGLTKYNNGFARKRSDSWICRRTSSRLADPNALTSSRDICVVALGNCCTSGNDFFLCNVVVVTGIDCSENE